MQFLVDAQLPRAICAVLAHPDHDVAHVKDVLPLDVADADIWRMALAEARVIVTKDEDFARRLQSTGAGPQIVWIRIGNCSNAALVVALTPIWARVCDLLASGEKLIEVR
jgi:predicted nuclease of predicted toxin-antitoxin system